METQQEFQTPGGEGNQDKAKTSHYPSYRRTIEQIEPTLIHSGSQGVNQPDSPVALHHSGSNTSVTKSYHSSQSQAASRRRQGYKGKNKISFSHR
ncbi:hypothetical protein O181_015715 [Austropuccinia psidii MF-1]|uniref:Uncharacterized protein n=1 Tax=Austropuccinia psidii MF-1 TaxID=1389203 RepID=A0A9Q3C3G5_9BASI|nr:hypothetical protein [Austropuccinia psidii MF-1]